MMSYWAEFAISGSPGAGHDGALAEWSAFDGKNREATMVFDTQHGGGPHMSHEYEYLDVVLEAVETDPRLKGSVYHCISATEILRYFSRFDGRFEDLQKLVCN